MKPVKAKINGKLHRFHFDMAAILEYGQLIGADDVNEIQSKMGEVLGGMNEKNGKVRIDSVQGISKLAYIAARTGAYHDGKDLDLSERDMTNAIMSDEGGEILLAVVESINQLNGGALASKKKKPSRVKK